MGDEECSDGWKKNTPFTQLIYTRNGKIVAVVYFRGGYSPNDYPTEHVGTNRLSFG